jgi:quinol-cytochrome oxidoreductase complex cytochrome b subunit
MAGLLERLSRSRVPSTSVPHYTGGVLIFLFLLQVATGILLMLPFRVDPAHAHASVETIVGQIPYGALMRGIHAWASNLFVATVMIHFAASLLQRRYRAPNELVWLLGIGLLVVGVGMAFTGAILPWNQSGYLQARVSSEMLGQGPFFGGFVKRLLRGGEEITPWTMNHAYGFHTGVLPAATTVIVLLHTVVLHRRVVRPGPGAPSTIPAYPDFVLRMAALCVGVMAVVVSLATFVHVPLGEAADLRATIGDARPPWYLLFAHDLVGAAPPRILGLPSAQFILGALSVLGLFVVALPFIDRRGSRITMYLGLVAITLWGILTVHAAL